MNKFDISVVIPIYNKEKFLESALKSILSQQAIELEIICIDDDSKDDSYHIACKILSNYSNVVCVKNKTNIGVAESRNLGISIARGEYICFFDADDLYPNENVLSLLYNAAHKESADIVGGSFSDFTKDKETIKYYGELSGYSFENDGWVLWREYQFEYGFTRFLYKRDFLKRNSLFFLDLIRFQDPPFLVKAMHTAGKFYAIQEVVYKYRIPENGIQWNENKVYDCIQGICWNMQFAISNNYWKLYELSICRFLRLLSTELVKEVIKNNNKISSAILKIRNTIQTDINYKILSNADINAFENILNIYSDRKQLITFIIPAFNVERYIKQCIDSLLRQTNQNFKIIIVNDGSTDDTGKICEKYASLNPNLIKYIYQDNKGLGAARNAGLKLVATKYITFLDSDDWQDIRFVEKFNKLVSELNFEPDLLFTIPKCYNEASKKIEEWMDTKIYAQIFYESIDFEEKAVNVLNCPELYLLEVNANRKIYRTDFLHKNKFAFPEGVKWEDIRPHIQLLHLAKSCVPLADTGFIYRINYSKQITSGRGADRLDFIKVLDDVILTVNSRNYSMIELAYIMQLLCKYTQWMIEMTNMDYIDTLLEGLHRIYSELSGDIIDAWYAHNWSDLDEFNKFKGLVSIIRSHDYYQLSDYITRQNLYRFWMLNKGKKKTVIRGGIQCVKDSGLKYTIKLLLKKILYQGFK